MVKPLPFKLLPILVPLTALLATIAWITCGPLSTPATTQEPESPMSTLGGHKVPKQPSSKLDEYEQKVGKGVVETLLSKGEASVVVALVNPTSSDRPQIDQDRIREEIGKLQDQVLSELDSSEFLIKVRFDNISGFAGTVLSEPGLVKLASHPHVKKIDLDVDVSGGT
jgi:hypothetical protein